jgi:hypothetical protein
MAIGISGTNSNSSSVEVSVGPMAWVHIKDPRFVAKSLDTPNQSFLYGCFDPGNKKTNAYGGTSGIDYVSGFSYTITGSANNYAQFKSENLGIIELTGDGYIKSDSSYQSSFGSDENQFEFWLWPATGPTQEQAIFQFRKNDGGTYKSGFTLVMRGGIGNNRQIRLLGYRNDGTLSSVGPSTGGLSNALFLNTWNHIIIHNNHQPGVDFSGLGIRIRSPFHEYYIGTQFLDDIGLPGTNSTEYELSAPRELMIGKADGITGTFRGKIGCCKIFNGLISLATYDPENDEPNNVGHAQYPVIAYNSLAPRYDQYL